MQTVRNMAYEISHQRPVHVLLSWYYFNFIQIFFWFHFDFVRNLSWKNYFFIQIILDFKTLRCQNVILIRSNFDKGHGQLSKGWHLIFWLPWWPWTLNIFSCCFSHYCLKMHHMIFMDSFLLLFGNALIIPWRNAKA